MGTDQQNSNNQSSIRLLQIVLLFLLALFAAGNVSAEESANKPPEDPVHVNFSILGAVIAPTKENGKPWDGFSFSSGRTTVSKVGNILKTLQSVSAIETAVVNTAINNIVSLASSGPKAPDVIGYVYQVGSTIRPLTNLAGTAIALATRVSMNKDSYTPVFNVTYEGWPIFKDSRFRIQLWDADLEHDDPIGTVEITYSDIMQAIKVGKSTWINVAEQGSNQLLFIHISAMKALNNTRPKIDGYAYR